MKKKINILVLFTILGVTAWLAIAATIKSPVQTKDETCSEKCKSKHSSAPGKGFFIVDSYSGTL